MLQANEEGFVSQPHPAVLSNYVQVGHPPNNHIGCPVKHYACTRAHIACMRLELLLIICMRFSHAQMVLVPYRTMIFSMRG